MPELLSNEAKLYYDVRGEGFPIIFTHGASWNHLQWKKQVEFLKINLRLLPGMFVDTDTQLCLMAQLTRKISVLIL